MRHRYVETRFRRPEVTASNSSRMVEWLQLCKTYVFVYN